MQLAEDLELPHLPMEEASFAEDPVARFAEARRRHPWLARWTYGLVVTEYEAMRELFRMDDKMRNTFAPMVELMGAEGTPWGGFQTRHMLSKSGEAHKRLRDVLAFAFTPRQANRHRGLMRQVIAELLDEWAPKRAFDFEEFASNFPITVMCRLIGASPEVIPSLRTSMEAIGMSTNMDHGMLAAMQRGVEVMDEFVHRLMAERRAHPTRPDSTGEPDLLDILLRAQDEGGLTDRELADILIFLFVAGYDTSKNVLTLTMYELLQRPEIYKRCAQDLEYSAKVVEESLRFHGTTSSSRIIDEDVVYRDVLLRKDTMLWFPFSMATRDPAAVDDADEFLPERAHGSAHMAFGLGPHICLGQYLARAQIAEGLHQIAQRISEPKSPGPNAWRPFPGVWGIHGLPIEFEPAEAVAPVS
jgi:cytochrome P450